MSLASRLNEHLPAAWQDIDPPEAARRRSKGRCAMLMIGGVEIWVGAAESTDIGSDWWFCCAGEGVNWRRWETLLTELPHVAAHVALLRLRQTPPIPMPAIPSWALLAFDKQRAERLAFITNRIAWANRLADTLNEERRVLEATS